MAKKAGTAVYKKNLQIKIKPMTHDKLREIAVIRGEDVSKVVRTAIQAEIKKSGRTGE